MPNHTPEPWSHDGGRAFFQAGGQQVGRTLIPDTKDINHDYEVAAANAERIVTCVNACAGIENEALKTFSYQQLLVEMATIAVYLQYGERSDALDMLLSLVPDEMVEEARKQYAEMLLGEEENEFTPYTEIKINVYPNKDALDQYDTIVFEVDGEVKRMGDLKAVIDTWLGENWTQPWETYGVVETTYHPERDDDDLSE